MASSLKWLIFAIPLSLLGSACDSCGSTTGGPEGCQSDAECPDGQFCVSEECVDCRVKADCPEGQVCQDGTCVQDCPIDDKCESGGDCCPGTYECIDRVCRPPCDGTRCGHRLELCCSDSQVCEDERCLIDCPAEQRCGRDLSTCCSAEQICYGFSCTTPGDECTHQSDCPDGQVCEVDLHICIDAQVLGDCEYHPPPGEFNPAVDCRWTPPDDQVTPHKNDVVMAPSVANLTDDNGDGRTDTFDIPEIVFISYDLEGDGCCNVRGTLRVVSGQCYPDGSMNTLASINEPHLDNSAGVALGDLDGDGVPEIVTIIHNGSQPQGTVAFKRAADDGSAWTTLWTNPDYPTWNVHSKGGTQPALVDLTGDGTPEVLVGNVALHGSDGSLFWDGLDSVGPDSGVGNNAFLGPVSTAADIYLDGKPEVLAGNTCYSWDGQERWTFDFPGSGSWCGGDLPCDGYTATGNFDSDPQGEVVIVRLGEVYVLNHDGTMIHRLEIPWEDCLKNGEKANESGPPTVADFDNDGRPEIGTAAADYYTVMDPDCYGDPLPDGCAAEGILWFVDNQDCSSRVTASSVFDFDGDGQAEAIYADETSFRIFDGATGTVLYQDDSHGSHTRLEMVVIADVDNDGNAEVVISENTSQGGTAGVEVWGDVLDNWVFTRRIWNQHSYHVTNVSEDGIIPAYEEPNWSVDHLNNFRQNVQGEGLFFAPDLVVINLGAVCELDLSLYITFDVMNQGSRMIGPGAAISLYADDTLIDTLRTTRTLLPGQLEHFSYSWEMPPEMEGVGFSLTVAADDIGDGSGEHNECEDGGEDNNSAVLSGLFCGIVD